MDAPKTFVAPFVRTALGAVAAGGVITLALVTGPAAGAAPDPCAASSVAKTVGAVATNTGVYLAAHPETDQALTAISQQPPGPQSVAMLKAYFDSNPEVATDMQRLQQPLATLSGRCRLPVTLPQMLGLLQSVQQGQGQGQGQGPPAQLPATQNVGAETAPASEARGPVSGTRGAVS
ncbi:MULTISPECIES: hemophore [Mycobacteriaceae]|uniref:Hemophore n=1 Tax=Mycolicibacterium parafortuitum TaxID=39692 RepID=A0ACC6MIG8_MYCPF|nr:MULTISPECIES: hemophore [Mycobacteriaceae]MDZ5086779.1 hemophore [Mycolicibacterium parafortuitum]GFM21008.1 hypothetical protein PO1_contig-098-9 [Mycobacterium sp. PO1]